MAGKSDQNLAALTAVLSEDLKARELVDETVSMRAALTGKLTVGTMAGL